LSFEEGGTVSLIRERGKPGGNCLVYGKKKRVPNVTLKKRAFSIRKMTKKSRKLGRRGMGGKEGEKRKIVCRPRKR